MSVKILSITLLLLSICVGHSSEGPAPPGKPRPCCVDVANMDMSAKVVGETYREQPARPPPCVKAILFNTGNGKQLCADPHCQWVKDLTAKMTKVY